MKKAVSYVIIIINGIIYTIIGAILMKNFFNKETVTYLIFGVMTTVVNYGVFFIFYNIASLKSTVANIISFIAAVLFSFVTNKIFVFESRGFGLKVIIPEAIRFIGARLFTFALEEIGLFVCDDILKLYKTEVLRVSSVSVDGVMLAKITLAFVTVIINYIFCKIFIFKRGKNEESSAHNSGIQ